MESFESTDNLNEDVPNLLFFYVGLSFLIVAYLLKDISVVGVFHHEAIKMHNMKLMINF